MHPSDTTTSDIPRSDQVSGIIDARGDIQKIDFGKTRKDKKKTFCFKKIAVVPLLHVISQCVEHVGG